MAMYFFDVHDGPTLIFDDDGYDLPNLKAVQRELPRALVTCGIKPVAASSLRATLRASKSWMRTAIGS
jgi:hypothetical protein